jgi:hypothetical protein
VKYLAMALAILLFGLGVSAMDHAIVGVTLFAALSAVLVYGMLDVKD